MLSETERARGAKRSDAFGVRESQLSPDALAAVIFIIGQMQLELLRLNPTAKMPGKL